MGKPRQGDPLGVKEDVPSVEEIREALGHASLTARQHADQAEARARRDNGEWSPADIAYDDRIHAYIDRLLALQEAARSKRKASV